MSIRKITSTDELIKELGGNGYFGLRGASNHDLEIISTGRDYLDCSQDNWDSRDCEYKEEAELLPGTSAIYVDEYMNESEIIKRYNAAYGYANNHHGTKTVLLINDKSHTWGVDENEVILGNGYGADIIGIVEI